MKYSVFIGIDVSKDKLDFVVLLEGKKVFHMEVENNSKGIRKFIKALVGTLKVSTESCLFCLEHTGIYCEPFLDFTSKNNLDVWLEDAKKIKVYHSLAREKNDVMDAYRIAEYAYAKQHQIKLWKAPRAAIILLKRLLKLRKRLVDGVKRFKDPLNEEVGFYDSSWNADHKKMVNPIVSEAKKSIKEIEKQILKIIKEDEMLRRLFEVVSSVQGVGLIVGVSTEGYSR